MSWKQKDTGRTPHQLLQTAPLCEVSPSIWGSSLCSSRPQQQCCPLHSPVLGLSLPAPTTAQLPFPTRHISAGDSTFSNCISSYSTTKCPVLEHCAKSQAICKGSLRTVSSQFLFLFKRKSGEVLFLGGRGRQEARIVLL